MPHFGQRPKAGPVTSGCIGQLYTVPVPGFALDAGGPELDELGGILIGPIP